MHIRSVSRIIVMKSKGKTWTKKDWILEIFYTVMRSTGWESNGLCGLGSCCLILRVTFSPSAKCQTNYSQPAAAKPARSSQYRISFSFIFHPALRVRACVRVCVNIIDGICWETAVWWYNFHHLIISTYYPMPQYAVPTDQFVWKKHKYITVRTLWFFLFFPQATFLVVSWLFMCLILERLRVRVLSYALLRLTSYQIFENKFGLPIYS